MRQFEKTLKELTAKVSEYAKENEIPMAELVYLIDAVKDSIQMAHALSESQAYCDETFLKRMPIARREQ